MSPKPGKPEQDEKTGKAEKPAPPPPPEPDPIPGEVYGHLRDAQQHLTRALRALPPDRRRARAMIATALDALASRHLKVPR